MRKTTLLLILFLAATASFVTAFSANVNGQEVELKFWDQAKNSAGYSYIVEYHTPSAMFGDGAYLSSGSVSTLNSSFKQSLPANLADKVTQSFNFLAASVMQLSESELAQVKRNPRVKGVYVNRINRLSLGESKNIVLRGRAGNRHSGKGQSVAILDTGVDNQHSFFETDGNSRIVSEACFTRGGFSSRFREIKSLCPIGGRVQIGQGAGDDCTELGFPGCDHGTHVAGIAAGNDGIASEANIISINVFTGLSDVFNRNVCGIGFGRSCIVAFDSDIIFGLERVYALRNIYNIAAVNMSLGSGQFGGNCNSSVPKMTNIIDRLKDAGIATVIASGNDGHSSQISYPACISNAIAVGATSDFDGASVGNSVFKDLRVFYSNNGLLLDLYAPGTLIRSSVPNNGFSNFNGTSMAAPHVAGGFAVVKSQNVDLTVDEIEGAFKSVGPNVEHAGVERRRLDIVGALKQLGLFKAIMPTSVIMMLLEDSPSIVSPPPPPPGSCSFETIAINQTKTDAWSISSDFSTNKLNSYSKLYSFILAEPATVIVTLEADVDTFLFLHDDCGTANPFIASDNDGGIGTNSQVSVELNPGVYTIDATTLAPRQIGDFSLSITSM